MISDYENENRGLKMINIKLFNKALKSSWVKKYLEAENHRVFGGDAIFKGNLNKEDVSKHIKISDAFTQEIIQIRSEINYTDRVGGFSSIKDFTSQNLWQSSLI